jgi:type VI protein secretion system component VasK
VTEKVGLSYWLITAAFFAVAALCAWLEVWDTRRQKQARRDRVGEGAGR